MYEPGQTVKRYCRIFPASATPWQEPLPVRPGDGGYQAVMLCAIVTENYLTFGWQAGQTIFRADVPITEEQAEQVGFNGGEVAGFMIGRRGGCRCNANLLNGWDPFPGVNLVDATSINARGNDATYGLIPPRTTGPVKYARI